MDDVIVLMIVPVKLTVADGDELNPSTRVA
jgi:hypothetical protein